MWYAPEIFKTMSLLANISKKVHATLHNLRNNAYYLPTNIKLKLVNALILPHLDYAAPVYSNIINSLDTKLNKLLNSSLRFVYSLKRSQHIFSFFFLNAKTGAK